MRGSEWDDALLRMVNTHVGVDMVGQIAMHFQNSIPKVENPVVRHPRLGINRPLGRQIIDER